MPPNGRPHCRTANLNCYSREGLMSACLAGSRTGRSCRSDQIGRCHSCAAGCCPRTHRTPTAASSHANHVDPDDGYPSVQQARTLHHRPTLALYSPHCHLLTDEDGTSRESRYWVPSSNGVAPVTCAIVRCPRQMKPSAARLLSLHSGDASLDVASS